MARRIVLKRTVAQVALRVCNDLLLKCESELAWFDIIEQPAVHSNLTSRISRMST